MKKIILMAVLISTGSAFAAEAPDHPCRQIVEACKSAGFAKGHHKEGKGLFKDCLQPISEGKSVPGVTVEPSVAQACQAKRAAHKDSKKKQS